MMSMAKVTFKVVGMTPLLCHSAATLLKTDDGSMKSGKKRIPKPEDEARMGCYRDAEERFCVPTIAFRAAILRAARNKKIGKTRADYVIAACVQGDDSLAVLRDPETWKPLKGYVVDVRRVVVQGQGVMRARPRFDRWACEITLSYNTEMTDANTIKDLLAEAGIYPGVGDYRPGCKGWFGTFRVID